MQLQVYAIKDKAANAYLQPFYTANEATALRSLSKSLQNPGHDFHVHAKDFSLYYLGVFDDYTGVHVPLAEPHFVVNCETLLTAVKADPGIARGNLEDHVNG